MELSRISDIAARQAIDSMKVFKEYLRVSRELDALGGSMFWKKVGHYEYLAHKVRGGTEYKGVRSSATEVEYETFFQKKEHLKSRFKTLKNTVEVSQRLNKAVHAGTVPSEIIDVLTVLEQIGLAQHSLVLGVPALYAYVQSSGVSLQSVKNFGQKDNLLESHPHHLHLLIESSQAPALEVVNAIKKALSRIALVEQTSLRAGYWLALKLQFVHVKNPKGFKPKVKATKSSIVVPKAATVKALKVSELASWMKTIIHTPKYEQVVVGKTGKMALMRTLDPQVFLAWEECAPTPATINCSHPTDDAKPQVEVVEKMIGDSMLISKVDKASSEALKREIQAWYETIEGSAQGIHGNITSGHWLAAAPR